MAGSAGTVAVAFLGMAFTKLGVFSSVGPALAVTVLIGFFASATLLPALIVLAGRRGWVKPRRDLTGRFWRRSGVRIVRKPKAHLAASLVILIVLAGCATLVKFNYDDRKNLPADAASNVGAEVMKRHFPEDATALQFMLIQSPNDLRTPRALADLEEMARRVSQVPDIARVRGVTRPTGEVLEEAKVTSQVGEVGTRLQEAAARITENDANLSRLTEGAHQLADALAQVQGSVNGGVASARPVMNALDDMQSKLDQLIELSLRVPSIDNGGPLDQTVQELRGGMESAKSAVGNVGGIGQQLGEIQQGASALAAGSRQLADGVQQLVDQTRVMGSGLEEASAFLLTMKRDAADPSMAGFYIPPHVLTQGEFKKAASLFISEDGHTARYVVETALDPFSTAAMDQLNKVRDIADSAKPNTTLSDSTISMVGATAFNKDVRNYYNDDIRFIIFVTLIVVFLILALILHAIVAPLYLVLSVMLSYMSAVGIGVLFFQYGLGQEMAWSLPGTAFLILVAVGADYNLLLISRIRDEAHIGLRSAVIRTVGATGGVITSAGLIFAASMLGLTVSSIQAVVQMGFIIGVGLLLDTFVVRTVTVPAMAVLVGKANWWPSKPPSKPRVATRRPSKRVALPADVVVVTHASGSFIEEPSTLPGPPQRNGHFWDDPRPSLVPTYSLKPVTMKVAETALGGHMSLMRAQPLPVDNSDSLLLDPQSTGDYWGQYLAAAGGVAAHTNGNHFADTDEKAPAAIADDLLAANDDDVLSAADDEVLTAADDEVLTAADDDVLD